MAETKPKSYLGQKGLPRGMRNNNPGNIKIQGFNWKGRIPSLDNRDKVMEAFIEYRWGVRAMIVDLRTKIKRGLNTIEKIIQVYAPTSENDTNAYIKQVVKKSGYKKDLVIPVDDKAILKGIVQAMAFHENGREAITDEDFDIAWELL